MLPISRHVTYFNSHRAKKSSLITQSIRIQPFTSACREWWIGHWPRFIYVSIFVCACTSWIRYRMDIISYERLLSHYVTNIAAYPRVNPRYSLAFTLASYIDLYRVNRHVKDHVPICIINKFLIKIIGTIFTQRREKPLRDPRKATVSGVTRNLFAK